MLIAVCARFTRRVNTAGWLLVAGLAGLAPLALGGHAAGAADHDLAVLRRGLRGWKIASVAQVPVTGKSGE